MVRKLAVAVAGMAVLAAGFSAAAWADNNSPSPKADPQSPAAATPSQSPEWFEAIDRNREFAETLVGMSEDEALAAIAEAGLSARITARDGEFFPVTLDFRSERINLEIADQIVTTASVG